MLADRIRAFGIAGIVGASIVGFAGAAVVTRFANETPAAHEATHMTCAAPQRPAIATPVTTRSPDTLVVELRSAPEWTGVVEESDWAKSYHMAWNGPIRSWTTMRNIRVPSLDHRMIESIELADPRVENRIRVRVRVVVSGDLEAARDWVASNPAVNAAAVEMTGR